MTFRPLLLPSVMTAVLLPILCGLGWWQLERLEWKTICLVLAVALPIALMRLFKATLVALQYHHSAAEGRLDE